MNNVQNTSSQSYKTVKTRISGFTLLEMMTVVFILSVLLNIAAPTFITVRSNSRARSCVENLRNLDESKCQYVLDNRESSQNFDLTNSNWTTKLTTPVKYLNTIPTCPASGVYNIGTFTVSPTCSFGSSDGPLDMHQLPT
jgi:prepilin-type N-terminal cleavage/methylation domain-containing protein